MSATRSSSSSEQPQVNANGFDDAALDGVAAAAEELISCKVKIEQECLQLEAENARLIEGNARSKRRCLRLVSRNMHLAHSNRHLIRRYNALTIENAENRYLALESESLQAEVNRLRQENESQAETIRQMMASQNYAGPSPPQSSSSRDELSDKGYSTDPGAEADDEDSGDEDSEDEDSGDESSSEDESSSGDDSSSEDESSSVSSYDSEML